MRRLLPALAVLPAFFARPEPIKPVAQIPQAVAVELSILRVDIGVPVLSGGFRWEAESMGNVLAQLEAQLVLIEGLVPSIGTAGPAASLSEAPVGPNDTWIGAMESSGSSSDWQVTLTVCQPYSPCEPVVVVGDTGDTWSIAESLADHVAGAIARPRLPLEPLKASTDRYARLIAGRGAAEFYGIVPGPSVSDLGNRRRDSVERAILMDTSVPLSWWLLGRHRLNYGRPDRAIAALRSAGSVGTARSDYAMALSAAGRMRDARDAWGESVAEPRFALSAAAAAIQAEDTVSAEAWLALLPNSGERDPALLRLLVKQAGDSVDEELLIEWSEAAPADPRPVDAHIRWLVHHSEFERALELTEELARRGDAQTAQALEYALSVELGDQVPSATEDRSPRTALELASDDAARGDTQAALRQVRSLLRREPHNTQALALFVDLSLIEGDNSGAREAYARLLYIDPSWGREGLPWR